MAFTIAHRVCGNVQDAEDVVQESFVKVYRNLHTFRNESKFSSWLYRIVYNTAITQSKTKLWVYDQEMSLSNVEEVSDFNAETQIIDSERTEAVADVLNKMSKGEALLLTLYYLKDNPVKEIARITGLNESNVKVKLFRARQSFKELYARYERVIPDLQ
jgi:RNA polymerase sigma-70 factor (ECF subfamily)